MQHQDNDDSSIQRSQTPPNQPSLPNQPSHEAPQLLSTPRKSGTPRSTTNVTRHRSEILNQMKDEMVRCDAWSEGFDLYLPDVGIVKEDIVAAVEKLKKKHCLRDIDNGDQKLQFTDFKVTPSHIKTTGEKMRYKPLTEICEVLGNLKLLNDREASCKLIQEPNSHSSAETPGGNFIVDAYLKLEKSTMPPLKTESTMKHFADMAVVSEYKTWERDFLDNRKKILGAATFCMNDDPRRMHIYGITIEDSMMTVWYFSRSHSAKSPAFDFTKDPDRYIRVMLSFLFATEEELGYDPTIQRRLDEVPGKQTLCHVYKVKDDVGDKRERYFKTQGSIFEHRSLCVTGRATRVWKVVEVKSFDECQPLDGSILVLKDVWLDSQSKTECQNLDAIFQELHKLADLLDKGDENPDIFKGFENDLKIPLKECLKGRSWARYFLTKVCDWQGFESRKVPPTAQADSTLFDPPTPTPTPSSNPYSDQSRSTTTQATDLVPVAQNRPLRQYCPRRQYRVVFKEVCEALHHVQRLEDVATALLDSVFALQLMFLAGWVHRDISSGNIYACRSQENGTDGAQVRGILADLEYAKHFDPDGAKSSSDPKTGTAFFMAIEIQKQVLIYNPDATGSMPSRGRRVPQSNLPTLTSVIHNFEHDMESIFWLFLWILLVRFPSERSAEQEKEFAGVLSAIFQDTSLCPPERERVFTTSGALDTLLKHWLNPELRPISDYLLTLREALVVGYHQRKFDFGNRPSYAALYPFLIDALASGRIVAEAKNADSSVGDDNRPSPKAARVESGTDAASSQHQNPEVEENEESS
ncbi:hypothetical protein M407DRAFT_18367 [Tulasnella calospora MUT 4182]|uniref:Protein kinase domain-containing protein n=1 Tax=Tulasnella calospora MUT 4182 TaxID=1051891 RepID=A0A0C3LF42_9AGAM|nr:hypothetical protein M407DRAFT_18367 [Tulasnella calospora MUT 4182]